jgi:hypothetical protein
MEVRMAYDAKVIRIFIASPGDVQKERNLIRDTIYEWNTINSFSRGIVLMPVGWETDSVASYGAPPQDEINTKLLESCDLLIGVFWSKVGTPTDHSLSGTVEEIKLHSEKGKKTMLFFSTAPIPQEHNDEEQIAALKAYKESISGNCMYKDYEGSDSFKDLFVRQLHAKLLEEWVLESDSPVAVAASKANEIVKYNITKWSDILEVHEMSNWISHLTSASPWISHQKYEQLENLKLWILSRNWEFNHQRYSEAFYRFRLILQDLLDVIMDSSVINDREIYRVEKRYHKIEWNPEKYERLAKDYDFRVALIQDLAIELCRATNFILDVYRREIDPLFLINTGSIFITTGPHYDLNFHFYIVHYKDDEKSIPYKSLDQFKIDRKNRDISMGRGKDSNDPEFLEWNNR